MSLYDIIFEADEKGPGAEWSSPRLKRRGLLGTKQAQETAARRQGAHYGARLLHVAKPGTGIEKFPETYAARARRDTHLAQRGQKVKLGATTPSNPGGLSVKARRDAPLGIADPEEEDRRRRQTDLPGGKPRHMPFDPGPERDEPIGLEALLIREPLMIEGVSTKLKKIYMTAVQSGDPSHLARAQYATNKTAQRMDKFSGEFTGPRKKLRPQPLPKVKTPAQTLAASVSFLRSPLLLDQAIPGLVGKTIAGGEPVQGATTTANIGLRTISGLPNFGQRAFAAMEKKRKNQRGCYEKAGFSRKEQEKCDEIPTPVGGVVLLKRTSLLGK